MGWRLIIRNINIRREISVTYNIINIKMSDY